MAKITVAGDFLCYPIMTERFGSNFDVLYEKAGKLKNCDYLIGNLESPIAGEEMRYTFERYCFNTPVAFIQAMKRAGFDMLTLANNHCMDRYEEGLLKTLENCKKEGFDTVGLYASEEDREKTFVKEIDGIKIAFVNYTYGTNAFAHRRFLKHPYMVNLFQPEETKKGSIHLLESNEWIGSEVERIYNRKDEDYALVEPHLKQLEQDIQKAKERADYVVMIMHSGGQYNEKVDPYSKYVAKKIKEFGADIIVGNHPHIIQESENKDGYLTVFSLGNFIDAPSVVGEKEIDFTYNAVLYLTLEKEDGRIVVQKEFGLWKVVEENGKLYAADTYDLYQESKDEKLKRDILYFANRFAGEKKYDSVQEIYKL